MNQRPRHGQVRYVIGSRLVRLQGFGGSSTRHKERASGNRTIAVGDHEQKVVGHVAVYDLDLTIAG